MHINKNTRRIIAGFMLVIFALSITPRIVLHGWFASHKDAVAAKFSHSASQQFTKAGFNCNCDNVVAESPFTGPVAVIESYTFRPYTPHPETIIRSFQSVKHFSFSLRGPPAIG